MKYLIILLLIINSLISCREINSESKKNQEISKKYSELQLYINSKINTPTTTKDEYDDKIKNISKYFSCFTDEEILFFYNSIIKKNTNLKFDYTSWNINEVDKLIIENILLCTNNVQILEQVISTTPLLEIDYVNLFDHLNNKGIPPERILELTRSCNSAEARKALEYAYKLYNAPVKRGVRVIPEELLPEELRVPLE